jgi:hypothetical protein
VENLFVCSLHFVSGIHLYIITTSDNNNIYVILFLGKLSFEFNLKHVDWALSIILGLKKPKLHSGIVSLCLFKV